MTSFDVVTGAFSYSGAAIAQELRHVIRVPGTLILTAARVLGLALRDTLLTAEEYQAMAGGPADTDGPATGETAISQWIADHQDTLSRVYANELTRHFR